MTGYTPQEAIGQKPNILKSERQTAEYYRDLWGSITAGNIWRGELVNRRKDGTYYTEKMTITPVRNPDHAITNYIAIKEDVTDRRAAEEALRNQEPKCGSTWRRLSRSTSMLRWAWFLWIESTA